jgi:hypothetical protein
VGHRFRSLLPAVLIAGGLMLAAVAALGLLAAAGVPIAEDRRALPAEPGASHNLVHEVVLLGFAKVRVQELVFNKFDALTGFALSMVSVAAFMVALFIRAVGGADWRRFQWFWLLVAAGAAWLAFDELASVHESAGFTWELWFGNIPWFEYEGDLFIALYLIPAAAFLILERRVITQSRLCVRLLIAAVALFALDSFLDSTGSHLDELLEMAIAGMLVVAFAALAGTHLAAELRSVGVVPRLAPAVGSNGAMPHIGAVAVPGDGVRPST